MAGSCTLRIVELGYHPTLVRGLSLFPHDLVSLASSPVLSEVGAFTPGFEETKPAAQAIGRHEAAASTIPEIKTLFHS